MLGGTPSPYDPDPPVPGIIHVQNTKKPNHIHSSSLTSMAIHPPRSNPTSMVASTPTVPNHALIQSRGVMSTPSSSLLILFLLTSQWWARRSSSKNASWCFKTNQMHTTTPRTYLPRLPTRLSPRHTSPTVHLPSPPARWIYIIIYNLPKQTHLLNLRLMTATPPSPHHLLRTRMYRMHLSHPPPVSTRSDLSPTTRPKPPLSMILRSYLTSLIWPKPHQL